MVIPAYGNPCAYYYLSEVRMSDLLVKLSLTESGIPAWTALTLGFITDNAWQIFWAILLISIFTGNRYHKLIELVSMSPIRKISFGELGIEVSDVDLLPILKSAEGKLNGERLRSLSPDGKEFNRKYRVEVHRHRKSLRKADSRIWVLQAYNTLESSLYLAYKGNSFVEPVGLYEKKNQKYEGEAILMSTIMDELTANDLISSDERYAVEKLRELRNTVLRNVAQTNVSAAIARNYWDMCVEISRIVLLASGERNEHSSE
ncbi:hypothetical protein [Glutamicibacter arilaitensis]|uniref:hypothetical protein n=1 Tax=Glutamicibacter arilaitensis TaxID=256701 RepID=UPI003FD09F6F